MKKILALGADVKNCILFTRGDELLFGPEVGDLSDSQNFGIFKKAVQKILRNNKLDIILCDLHPGYFSTRFAEELTANRKPQDARRIQHHHAHIASAMQEHNIKKPVIGVSFDGTGFGTDGNMWGGEFLLVNRNGFRRLAHLEYHMMPGGDKVVWQPWRMVLSILRNKGLDFVKAARRIDKEAILSMCTKGINSPLSSSAGRLFDTCAALIGIAECATYEAEGPIKLEAMTRGDVGGIYEFGISKNEGRYIVETTPLFLNIVKDLKRKKSKDVISTKFHNSIAEIIARMVKVLSRDCGIKDVVLSGGVFQNVYLRKRAVGKLASRFRVFINERTPVNDFNISVGQYHIWRMQT